MVLYARLAARSAPRLFAADGVPARPVALVLGARVAPNGRPSRILAARLACAVDVVERGRAERLLLSGDGGRRQDEISPMQAWLEQAGVDEERVWIDDASYRTWDSLVRAREQFDLDGVILISQRDHLVRALYLAEALGLDAVGAVAEEPARPPRSSRMRRAVRESAARARALVDAHLWRPAVSTCEPRRGPPR